MCVHSFQTSAATMDVLLEKWIQEASPILKPKRHAGQTVVLQVWCRSRASIGPEKDFSHKVTLGKRLNNSVFKSFVST